MGLEVSLQHEGVYYGTARAMSMSGRQSVSGATIVVNGELVLRPSETIGLSIDDVVGHVDVEGAGDIGPLWSLSSFRAVSGPRGATSHFSVCFRLTEADIRAIDRVRVRNRGEQFNFVLWMRFLGRSSTGPVDSQAIITRVVSSSDWFAVLAGSQYEARYVIDVPVSGGRFAGELATAAAHYGRAIEQYKKASYTQVFVECRKVLESIRDSLALSPKGIAELDARQKSAWSNRECIEYARAAIHQVMHHSAHPGVTDDPGLAEADVVLALTGSMLRYYATPQS